ncbi:5-(carboxyamino)imidazole ribonucleotide synthase [Stratiformator vulcanicus]|uniref:N5-carboxyaminoimidazole ribonucleotide synthase n=1 Tax=Stratiformator vulcanicus TaxID=2527980 RepID=A0A517R113_9PLAN|nr:5-(carboxyamino)imidazole ribonucleotide synthase [Stratiformator vulcanicus]QDT37561.1 N5-carboxyaminoimidazole ribonucleotide synthase [Stratiformator vulcanicus]
MSSPILPGATLGVLGSGQLGRMFAIAARQMGYRVAVYSPSDDTPTGQVADIEIKADYSDLERVEKFAKSVSVVTFEFENVPSETVAACERYSPVRPGGNVLHVAQHRIREKSTLRDAGLPVTPFAAVRSLSELVAAASELMLPAILKTAAWGYDGKGQRRIETADELAAAWEDLATDEAILEAFVPFEKEVSVVGVRGAGGDFKAFGPIENDHQNHILDLSTYPANVSPEVAEDALQITRSVFETLDVVGVLCVEFFLTGDGRLLINELAPRPHNSGHLTIDSCATSQFEQQVRAVCGLPLGSVEQLRPAAMANLLGDLWSGGEPNWAAALAQSEVKLHLYGKSGPRPGRKVGHLTALAETASRAAEIATSARQSLLRRT